MSWFGFSLTKKLLSKFLNSSSYPNFSGSNRQVSMKKFRHSRNRYIVLYAKYLDFAFNTGEKYNILYTLNVLGYKITSSKYLINIFGFALKYVFIYNFICRLYLLKFEYIGSNPKLCSPTLRTLRKLVAPADVLNRFFFCPITLFPFFTNPPPFFNIPPKNPGLLPDDVCCCSFLLGLASLCSASSLERIVFPFKLLSG